MKTSVGDTGSSILVLPTLSLPIPTRSGTALLCASYYGEPLVVTSNMLAGGGEGVCTSITLFEVASPSPTYRIRALHFHHFEVDVVEGALRGRAHQMSQIDITGQYLPHRHPLHLLLIVGLHPIGCFTDISSCRP